MRYDADNIYCAIEAMESEPKNMKDAESIWGGNHLELFLSNPSMGGSYYHLAIDSKGKIYQSLATSGSSCDRNFDAKPEFKAKILSDRWLAEIRVPTLPLKKTDSGR